MQISDTPRVNHSLGTIRCYAVEEFPLSEVLDSMILSVLHSHQNRLESTSYHLVGTHVLMFTIHTFFM